MLKHSIRWIIPVAVLLVLAIVLVAVPAMSSHAATIINPNLMWNGH